MDYFKFTFITMLNIHLADFELRVLTMTLTH